MYKIELVKTCGACPEQYDAYFEGYQVGYLRLRHGTFRVDYGFVVVTQFLQSTQKVMVVLRKMKECIT